MTHILEKETVIELLLEFQLDKQMIKLYVFFSFNLDSQPNGGLAENCLTTFIPDNGDSPKWYDRPCVEENDSVGEPGHKFMCECIAPYLHAPDPQGNNFSN
jgi:hypothetical protein